MLRTLALIVTLAFAGCLSDAPSAEALETAAVAPGAAPTVIADSLEGDWTLQINPPVLGGVGIMGSGWPIPDLPRSFLGGNVTVEWSALQGAGDVAVTFSDGEGNVLWEEVLADSPSTFELEADDPRLVGAERVVVGPVMGGAAFETSFKVAWSLLVAAGAEA